MMHPVEAGAAFAPPPSPQALLAAPPESILEAVSAPKIYRTRLWRWSRVKSTTVGVSALLFVMLNPSTADGSVDDPTIRRCRSFQERYGYDLLLVANLFELRATDPRDLARATVPRNTEGADRNLVQLASVSDRVIVGWGDQGRRYPQRCAEVLKLLTSVRGGVYCLGQSKHGYPRHPLMVRSDTKLSLFAGHDG